MAVNAAEIILKVRNEQLKKELDESKASLNQFRDEQVAKFNGMVSKLVGFFSIRAGVNMLRGWVDDAQEADRATAVLAQTIKATDGAAGLTAEQMKDLADSLEEVTTFSSEATQAAEAIMVSFKNVKGDVFVESMKAAQDMATVMGGDVSGSAMQLGKALNDPVQGMSALARSGVSFSDSQKEMVKQMVQTGDVVGAQRIILAELKNEFGGAAEAAGANSWEPIKNRLGDIGEEIGRKLIPYINMLIPAAQGVVSYLTDTVLPYWSDVFNKMGEYTGGFSNVLNTIWEYIVTGAATAMAILEFTIGNAFNAVEAAAYGLAYGVLGGMNELIHLWTSTLPEAIAWFVDNFGNLMTDLQNFTGTVFTNMWDNIKAFIDGMINLLSGGSADFQFKALTDGLEATLTELPKFTERIPGELEKQMKAGLDAAVGRIKKDYTDKIEQAADSANDMLGKNTKKKLGQLKDDQKSFEGLGDGTGHSVDPEKEKEKDKKAKNAAFEDMEGLYKRIASAAAGAVSEEDKLKALEANTAALKEVAKPGSMLAGQSKEASKKGRDVADILESILVETRGMRGHAQKTAEAMPQLIAAVGKISAGGLV